MILEDSIIEAFDDLGCSFEACELYLDLSLVDLHVDILDLIRRHESADQVGQVSSQIEVHLWRANHHSS